MKIKILVLNSDSLAAQSVSDNRISHGFSQNTRSGTAGDMLQGSSYNRLLSLPAMLARQVRFALDDVCQVLCQAPGAPEDEPDAVHKANDNLAASDSRVLAAASFMDSCDFYTLDEGADLDCSYICSHFDFIFFFFHTHITRQLCLNESLIALLTRENCPPFMLFNVQAQSSLLKEISEGSDSSDSAYIGSSHASLLLEKIMPSAVSVWLVSPEVQEGQSCGNNEASAAAPAAGESFAAAEDFAEFYKKLGISAARMKEGLNGYLSFNRTASSISFNSTAAMLSGWLKWNESLSAGSDECSADRHDCQDDPECCPDCSCSGGSTGGAAGAAAGAAGAGAAACSASRRPEYAQVRQLADDTDAMAGLFGPQGRPFTLAVSSQLLVRSLAFGISPWGASLLRRLRDLWPQARIVVFMGSSWYSWVNCFDKDTVISGATESLLERGLKGMASGSCGGKGIRGNGVSAKGVSGKGAVSAGSAVTGALNQAVFELIKTELFKAQEDLPPFPECLDGGWYNAAMHRRCKQYAQVIDDCIIDYQYSDFASLNIDLMISDSVFEQIMALGHGIACLGLSIDMDRSASMSMEDFAIFNAASLDFTDINLPLAMSMYPALHDKGLMRMFNEVGHYGAPGAEPGSAGLHLPQLSLRGILEKGTDCELSRLASNFDYTAVNVLTDLMVRQSAAVMVDMAAAHTARKGTDTVPGIRYPGKLSRAESVVAQTEYGLQVAQLSNYTSSQRYQVQWAFLQYLALITSAALRPDIVSSTALQADLSRVSVPALNRDHGLFVNQEACILSFGCSRGQEACELLTLFNNQCVRGIDISPDAIASARQMAVNLASNPKDAVKYAGWVRSAQDAALLKDDNMLHTFAVEVAFNGFKGSMAFADSQEFKNCILKSMNEDQQARIKGIEPDINERRFNMVTAMTVLCRHPDTVGMKDCSSIYPFAQFDSLAGYLDSLVQKNGLLCIFNANYAFEDSSVAGKYIRLFPFARDVRITAMNDSVTAAQAGKSLLAAAGESSRGISEICLPESLVTMLSQARADEIHGYVSRFDSDSQAAGDADRGTIFLKISD